MAQVLCERALPLLRWTMDACVVVCVVVVGASLCLVAAVSLYLLRRRRMDTALTRPLIASENQTANFTGFTTYRIINVLTGEYLGESKFHYDEEPNEYYVLTTDCLLYTSPSPRD